MVTLLNASKALRASLAPSNTASAISPCCFERFTFHWQTVTRELAKCFTRGETRVQSHKAILITNESTRLRINHLFLFYYFLK